MNSCLLPKEILWKFWHRSRYLSDSQRRVGVGGAKLLPGLGHRFAVPAPRCKEFHKVRGLGVVDGSRKVVVVQNVNAIRLFDFRRTTSAGLLGGRRRGGASVGGNELLKRLERTSARERENLAVNEPFFKNHYIYRLKNRLHKQERFVQFQRRVALNAVLLASLGVNGAVNFRNFSLSSFVFFSELSYKYICVIWEEKTKRSKRATRKFEKKKTLRDKNKKQSAIVNTCSQVGASFLQWPHQGAVVNEFQKFESMPRNQRATRKKSR